MDSIEGVPIEIIEQRARPSPYAGGIVALDAQSGESVSGFLGADESLRDVLLQDWETVRKLGLTHIEIADHLNVLAQKGKDKWGELVTFEYTFRGSAPQALTASYWGTKGVQSDIFRPADNSSEGEPWGEFCVIKNLNTGDSIEWTPGIERYIRRYGFYEGGENNRYRIDPLKFMSILTGQSVEDLKEEYQL